MERRLEVRAHGLPRKCLSQHSGQFARPVIRPRFRTRDSLQRLWAIRTNFPLRKRRSLSTAAIPARSLDEAR